MVSDFQRTAWAKADFSPLPADTHIQLESTAPAEPPANLAILRVDGRAAGSQGSMQLDVEVGNYSPTARKVTVEVAAGQFDAGGLTGTCPPGRRTTLSEEIGVRRPGWQTGEARLVGVDDALAADNVCPFVLQVRPQPTYVLMTRQTKGRKATSSLFLECALAPTLRKDGRRDNQSPSVVRMDPASFDHAALAAGDLILLDHPGQALRRDGQAAGGAAASRPADLVRGRRTDRRHEPEAAGRGGRQRPANARRVHAAAGRPGAARSVPHLDAPRQSGVRASSATA